MEINSALLGLPGGQARQRQPGSASQQRQPGRPGKGQAGQVMVWIHFDVKTNCREWFPIWSEKYPEKKNCPREGSVLTPKSAREAACRGPRRGPQWFKKSSQQ